MDAATFSHHFEELIVQPAVRVGFEPWGKSLWMERDDIQVAVLRTDLRYTWPFEFTLVARHDCLRDFKDRVPPPRSHDPSEYPVKAPPSEATKLVKHYRYRPYNLGRFPSDAMDSGKNERKVREQLETMGRALVEAAPLFAVRLTPAVILREIERHGEGAWAEARWIEDYRSYIGAHDT